MGSIRAGVTAVAISSVLAVTAIGCGAFNGGGRLIRPGDSDAAGRVITDDTRPDKPYSYLTAPVCTATAEAVVITAVELSGGSGLKLTRFATLPSLNGRLGAVRGPLEQLGFDPTGPARVSTQCYKGAATDRIDTSKYLTDLGIELERVSAGSGSYDTLKVHYSDGEHERSLTIPFGVTLCTKGFRETPDCHD